jgi:uncharacterized protein
MPNNGGPWWRYWRGGIAAALLLVVAATIASVVAKPHDAEVHRVVFQINSDDPAAMKHAVSNSINLVRYYRRKEEALQIEIVGYGPGIDMFRTDKSPVRRVLEFMHAHFPEIAFVACGNTTAIMEQQEGHPLSFITGTRAVSFGIVELVKRQEGGWSYIRP